MHYTPEHEHENTTALSSSAPYVSNEHFLRVVFKDLPDGAVCWVTLVDGDPKTADRSAWMGWSFDLKDELTVRANQNPYFCISSFRGGAAPTMASGYFDPQRQKVNHCATHCIVLDDIGNGPSAKISPEHLPDGLVPTWMLETSRDNFQVGYALETPEEDGQLVARFLDALVAEGLQAEKDPGMKGVTRLVRLPDGENCKPKYLNGNGHWKHRLHSWNPEERHTLEQIAEAFGLDLGKVRESKGTGERTGASDLTMVTDPWVPILDRAYGLLGQPKDKGDGGTWLDMTCPWVGEHTDGDDSGTAYAIGGGFECFHGHCDKRHFGDVKMALCRHADAEIRRDAVNLYASQSFEAFMEQALPPLPPKATVEQSSFAQLSCLGPDFDARTLCVRPWISHGFLLRGYVTLMAGPTAIGKSTFDIVRAVQHAVGRSLNGEPVERASRVVLLNNEDDLTELHRRISAALKHFELTPADLDGRLHIHSGYGTTDNKLGWYDRASGAIVTTFTRGSGESMTETHPLADLMRALKEVRADIVVADPAIGFFQGVEENDNGAVEQVMGIWRRVAAECKVALWLTHHTGKLENSESHVGNINAARGASSAIAAARVGFTLARMSKATAKEQRIPWEEASRLRRQDNAKNNYAPDATEARWFRMNSAPVGNAGDFVGVPSPISLAAIERLPEELSAVEKQERDDVMRLCVDKFSGLSVIPFAKLESDLIEMFGVVVKTVRRKLKDFFPLPPVGEEEEEEEEIFFRHDGKIYLFHRLVEGEGKRARNSLVIRENSEISDPF